MEDVTSRVAPSLAALATKSAPMEPAAPGLFSTMTVVFRRRPSSGATARAMTSLLPPGAKGTTSRTVEGMASAAQVGPRAMVAAASMARRVKVLRVVFIGLSFTGGDLQVQERGVLLRAEDVAVARAAARAQAEDRELDRQARVVLDEIADARQRDAVEGGHRLARDGAGAAHPLIGRALAEDDVEGDLVDARVLAADGLGEVLQGLRVRHHRLRHDPTCSTKVGKSSIGSATARVWFTVQR